MMFDKTPRAMALLGTFQQECAEAIGAHQWNRFQLEICQKGTITVGNLVRARYLESNITVEDLHKIDGQEEDTKATSNPATVRAE
jgi:hypothetical protein